MLGLMPPARRRRPSLTPMIDVVFLLLVFFMLAARFGTPQGIGLSLAGAGGAYTGAPRLVTVLPKGVMLNGLPVSEAALNDALRALMPDGTGTVVLRPGADTRVQRMVDVIAILRAAGLNELAVLP